MAASNAGGPAKASLCIVNYNGMSMLPQVLSAARTIADRFDEIMVVDNSSTDGSTDYIRREFPTVRIVQRPDNLGPGAARNTALKEARSDLVLIMDNDVTLTADCVDQLVAALAQHPAAVLAAPAIVYAHQRDTVQYDGAECHFLGLQTLLHEDLAVEAASREAVRKVGSMVSCAFLVERSRLREVEKFDESFFIYFEDHDYGVRLRALGYEVLSVPQAQCFHGKGTEGLSIRQTGKYTSRRVFFLIRNRWLFVLKNFSARTLLVLSPLFLVYELTQFVMVIKKGWLREWWNSLGWVLRNLPAVLRERRRIQRLRRVRDRDLLVGGRIPFRAELTTSAFEKFARKALDAVVVSYWKVASLLI